MSNTAILLAGGSGSRMRGEVKDKVLEPLLGLPVILHSFEAFINSGCVEEVVFVCRDEIQKKAISKAIKENFGKLGVKVKYAFGGAERQDSVLNGLRQASNPKGLAFIHDGARPMVGAENIVSLCKTASNCGAAVLASRVTDTIKRIPKTAKSGKKCTLSDLDRSRLWAMQTPQVFIVSQILSAYEKIKSENIKITDDVAAAAASGIKTAIVENLSPNQKITVPEDIAYIEFLAMRRKRKDLK